jgi:nicotinate-nucleotide pyrophosphorylase (carboxylating)
MIQSLSDLIQTALAEDLGDNGDITSNATVDKTQPGEATILAKEKGILAGGFVVEKVFALVDPRLHVTINVPDGTAVVYGQEVINITGFTRSILIGERTALNFLGRLSGIASLTAKFCELVKNSDTRILDTRKTTPGLRWLEKYAVRMGGGTNHRIGLYDMMLIKENHIAAAGNIENAVSLCRQYLAEHRLQLKIEVETTNSAEVQQALDLNVDRIMLDNMTLKQIKEAMQLVKKRVALEISGGVNLANIGEYAQTGVDYISIGALTHSAKALDFSLLLKK